MHITSEPSWENLLAISLPIPRPAPVITEILFSRFDVIIYSNIVTEVWKISIFASKNFIDIIFYI